MVAVPKGFPRLGRSGVVVCFFLLTLVLGGWLYSDYGVTWDEPYNIGFGASQVQNVSRFFRGEPMIYTERTDIQAKTHGPVFDMLLESLRLLFNLQSSRSTLLMRHFVNFLSFYLGILAFYFLCLRRFKSRGWALIGCLALLLSPRLFADAFYNSSDIPFLSGFTFAVLTLLRWNEKKNWGSLLLHAFASALAMNLRSAGILIPAFTFYLALVTLWTSKASKKEYLKTALLLLAYLALWTLLVIALMPFLWENTFSHFIEIFKNSSQTIIRGRMLFMGNAISITQAPWYYNPVWILITTPIVYTVGFLAGAAVFFWNFFRRFKENETQQDAVFFLWLTLPVVIPILLHSILYDAWRHHFFIYPAFLLFALQGFRVILEKFETLWGRRGKISGQWLLGISFGGILLTMIQYHPHQNVYFNFLAGDRSKIVERFELDYWGASYRKLLEYLLRTNPSGTIKIAIANFPAWANIKIFPEKIQARFQVNNDLKQADYFIGNFRGTPSGYPLKGEVYSVTVDGMKLSALYKISKKA